MVDHTHAHHSSVGTSFASVASDRARSEDPAWAHARVGTSSASVASTPARSEDLTWAYAHAVPNAKNNTICLHCNKLIKRDGITRLKYHLAGIRGQVEPCKKVSSDIRFQMKQMIEDLKKSKQTKKRKIGRASCRERVCSTV